MIGSGHKQYLVPIQMDIKIVNCYNDGYLCKNCQ